MFITMYKKSLIILVLIRIHKTSRMNQSQQPNINLEQPFSDDDEDDEWLIKAFGNYEEEKFTDKPNKDACDEISQNSLSEVVDEAHDFLRKKNEPLRTIFEESSLDENLNQENDMNKNEITQSSKIKNSEDSSSNSDEEEDKEKGTLKESKLKNSVVSEKNSLGKKPRKLPKDSDEEGSDSDDEVNLPNEIIIENLEEEKSFDTVKADESNETEEEESGWKKALYYLGAFFRVGPYNNPSDGYFDTYYGELIDPINNSD
ncbi:hypothetical protein H312_00037 [Anncaliia algerae PRA339]|uniref:Uncharacterized protein n=1 Tax=Anncaliia algerae PRA339 TaxID=1288291 RepID=A0A059F5U4_9MICR|nr:hypothetical protein H312_00037 [Anncaliia algerae PRA339]